MNLSNFFRSLFATRFLPRTAVVSIAMVILGLPIFIPSLKAQTLTVVYSFDAFHGENPTQGVIRDAAGNLYGVTPYGGIFQNCDSEFGGGTVFRIDSSGALTLVHSFDNNNGEGCFPSTLTKDAAGNLYGTTAYNTVFKIDNLGTFSVLYTFQNPANGNLPTGLSVDPQGNLFGTTSVGGNLNCNKGIGCGTVFKVNAKNMEKPLYSFTGSPDGFEPQGSVIRDSAGNSYGTTTYGGSTKCKNGCGIVFKVDSTGKETVLYAFQGGADGANPWAPKLLRDADGNLYGTTLAGGKLACQGSYCGVVFKVDSAGNETVLHSFTGADGQAPTAGLIRDAAGNFYGTTEGGGSFGSGTVFKLNNKGNFIVLHNFGPADGELPWDSLILDAAGNLYGTTEFGGVYGYGTVFKLKP